MVAAAFSGRTLTFLCRSSFNSLRSIYSLHRSTHFFLHYRIVLYPSQLESSTIGQVLFPSILFGSFQSISTQASPAEFVDEVLAEVLSAMADSRSSGEELCAFYIDKLCNERNLSGAVRLIQALHGKNTLLPPCAYNRLLKAAGEENNIRVLCQHFKGLLVSGKSLCSSTYLVFAQAFIKESDVACLKRFIQEISELIPSTTIMNRIIFAFAECGQVDRALLIFYQMKTLKSKPDVVTYNTILGIFSRCGRIHEMLEEFASMKEESLIPDIVSYNTLITGLRNVGRLASCLVFLKEMCDRGIEPDSRTYNVLIDSFGKSGNIEESLRLFNEMKRRGICPSVHVYRSLISNLKKMGRLELAVVFSNEMKELISNHHGPKKYFKQKSR